MNIYDIAGNVWEWTLEKASDTYNPFVNRGGGCSRTGLGLPAACREYNSTDFSVGVLGFRVSLFQEKLNARDEKFETRGKNDNRKLYR